MFDIFIHRYLHVPYKLHSRVIKKGKKPKTTILFIHGIGNSGSAWDEAIDRLPDNTRVMTVDLLGFGRSSRPTWAAYDVVTQARAVFRTCLHNGIVGNLIIVGHSMGSLVAIELARRYPLLTSSLILCSPPLYESDEVTKRIPTADSILRTVYRAAQQSPEQFLKFSTLAMKYELINKAFNVTDENVESYMSALEAAIINQTSLRDIRTLTLPVHIIRGTLDPVLVAKHIKALPKENPHITVSSIVAGHEVKGRFISKLVDVITAKLQSP